MIKKTNKLYHILLLAVFSLPLSYTAAKKFYVYVDEHGNTVMVDKRPTHSKTGYKTIDEKGSVLESVGATLTPEEVQRQREIEESKAREFRLQKEREDHDAVLLQTYSSVEDILLARDNKIKALDIRIDIIKGTLVRLRDQIKRLRREAAALERSGQPVSDFYLQTISDTRRQISNNEAYVAQKENEKEAIEITSKADVKRFRELIGEVVDTSSFVQKDYSETFTCEDLGDCNKVWTLSQIYVTKHATTDIQLVTSSVIATASPSEPEGLGLAVTRQPKSNGKSEIVIELLCHQSQAGREHCASPAMNLIKVDFYKMLRREIQYSD